MVCYGWELLTCWVSPYKSSLVFKWKYCRFHLCVTLVRFIIQPVNSVRCSSCEPCSEGGGLLFSSVPFTVASCSAILIQLKMRFQAEIPDKLLVVWRFRTTEEAATRLRLDAPAAEPTHLRQPLFVHCSKNYENCQSTFGVFYTYPVRLFLFKCKHYSSLKRWIMKLI